MVADEMPRTPRGLSWKMRFSLVALGLAAAAATPRIARAGDGPHPARDAFVKAAGSGLTLRGSDFTMAGGNTYYLSYKSTFMVDDALDRASAQGFTTIRTWGAYDIGNQDGTGSVNGGGKADGVVYFQYWNGSAPAYNDGPDGLEHLDYVIYRAGQLGLKLVIPFVNNWTDFGGIDQYVAWLGGQYHDQFYTDPTIRGWYEAWISHLLERVNPLTGVAYKDDPTILAWELGNEPRCGGSVTDGFYPQSPACTTRTLIAWADDVSAFVKHIDPRHLLEVGDEGFYCTDPTSSDFTENCSQGVDTLAFARLRHIDMMSFHLYPVGWGKDVAWGTTWIQRHFEDARRLREPAVLGEYGLPDPTAHNPAYKTWADETVRENGAGSLVWMLTGLQDNGLPYPAGGFEVFCPSPVCTTLANLTAELKAGHALRFPPVADDDVATTLAGAAVTLSPLANDVAYDRSTIDPSTVDLDPATPGQQTTFVAASGAFSAAPDGTVTFTPATGFFGDATGSYVVDDSRGRASNAATLTVTVKGAILPIESFETGVDGWGPINATGQGTVAQTSAFATSGSFGLEVDSLANGWIGLNLTTTLDLTGKNHLLVDYEALAAPTSAAIAFKAGSGYTWCQTPDPSWGYFKANTSGTFDWDLSSLNCLGNPVPDLSQVHALWVYVSGPGTYAIDYIRAQQ
jgi:mannan endo-1,4-beta-mannosidase